MTDKAQSIDPRVKEDDIAFEEAFRTRALLSELNAQRPQAHLKIMSPNENAKAGKPWRYPTSPR